MIIHKTRFSSENLRELWEHLENYLGREIRIDHEDKDWIYLKLKDKEGKWVLWDEENGGRIEKAKSPCGNRIYWRWEQDKMVISPEELSRIAMERIE